MRVVASVTTELAPAQAGAKPSSRFGNLFAVALEADARRALLAVLDQGIVSGLGFATSAIIATSCGRTGLGIAHLALTVLFLLMNVQGELLNAPYTIFRGRKRGWRLHAYSGSLLVHQAILGGIGVVVVSLFIALNSVGVGPTDLGTSLWVLLFAGPFCLLHAFLRNFSFAAFQFRVAVVMDGAAAAMQLVILLLLVRSGMLTVPLSFVAMGAASMVACIGWYAMRPEPVRYVPKLVWRDWYQNWSFGRWTLASHLVGCAGNYVLPWLLVLVHDQGATGTFAGCGKLSALAATFVLGVSHFLSPKAVSAFNEHGVAGLNRVLFAAGTVFVVTVGGFCGFVGLTGDFLLVHLFGEQFVGTGSVALVLSLAVLANSLSVLGGNGLWAINRPDANLVGDLTGVALTLLAAALLVHSHGVMGVAIAAVIGGTVGAIVRGATLAILVKRISRQPAK